MTADELCQRARETMAQRGKTYDPSGEAERSMPRIVAMFNAARGKDLTETDGWVFMLCLKIVRGSVTPGHEDSALDGVAYAALDGVAYAALAGESALREAHPRPTPSEIDAAGFPWQWAYPVTPNNWHDPEDMEVDEEPRKAAAFAADGLLIRVKP